MAAHLRGLGYTVELQRFSFTPASLQAFPVFGSGLGGLSLVLLPFLGSPALPPWAGLLVWGGGLLGLAVLAAGIGLGWVPFGEGPREDANLIATRAGHRPRRWIVAHLDSKAQGHSMAGRLVAVWVTSLAITVLTIFALTRLFGALAPGWLGLGAALALLAGFLAGKGRLRGRSLGARDNGTGVIAALTAAASTSDPGIGILITGAEEFGLVGARVFGKLMDRPGQAEFVNIDTVDEEGKLYLVSHDERGARLAQELERDLLPLGLPIQHRRLPLGIFVDSAPLARTGAPSITIGRLTWNTLRRIHTPADTPEGLAFTLAEGVGRAVVRTSAQN